MRGYSLILIPKVFLGQFFKTKAGSFGQRLSFLRYFPEWFVNNYREVTTLVEEKPWISFAALEYLDSIVFDGMKVFEYGAGGSTMYFASKAKELVTLEHDESWLNKVKSAVSKYKTCSWQCHFVPGEPLSVHDTDFSKNASDPKSYRSSDEAYKGYQFRKYVGSIDKFADGYFDLVFVDGRARASCLQHSFKKIKPGGYLVLDNSDRPEYLAIVSPENNGFELKKYCAGPGPFGLWFSGTTFWKKSEKQTP